MTIEEIKKFLKEIEIEDLIKNIEIKGKHVNLEVITQNPTLHEKKRMELALRTAFEKKFGKGFNINLHFLTSPFDSKVKSKEIKNIKNIIAISSGKGGVGKSTVASNIAITLAKMGFKVGLLDADIYGPSIPTMFDVENRKPLTIEIDGKSKIEPIENYGVKLLSIGFFAKLDQAVVWRGPMASKALNQMIHDAHWGELDFLILDLPPGTGDIHLSLVQSLPVTGAVIVSTPQKVALADARKGVAMFQLEEIKVPVLGIVENMAYFIPKEFPNHKYYIFGEEGAKHLAENLHIPFLGEIPLIQSIREAGDAGRPAAMQQNTEVEYIYKEVVKDMLEQVIIRNKTLPETEIVKITTMSGCSPK